MSYKSAKKILPANILEIIQQYVDGEYIYIPRKTSGKKGWGEKNGTKKLIRKRNNKICEKHKKGYTIKQLATSYYLSEKSIRKIILKQRNM